MNSLQGLSLCSIFLKFFFCCFLFAFISCEGDSKKVEQGETAEEPVGIENDIDSTELQKKEKKKPKIIPRYHLDTLTTAAEVNTFKTKYSKDELAVIAALNRIDTWRIGRKDELVVPDSIVADFDLYSPFPETLDFMNSIPKAVVVSRRIQAIALYENGKFKLWGPASTGKRSSQTPRGLYYGNYKARKKISTINSDWIMPYYFNYMNFEGIGTHQYTLPGYPASHGCVRLRREDAVQIYNWADQWELSDSGGVVVKHGTPFMVIGDYDFKKLKPWLQIAEDPKANFLTSKELDSLQVYARRYAEDGKNFQKEKEDGLIATSKNNEVNRQ